MSQKTFQAYLEDARKQGITDFRVVLQPNKIGPESLIYIHPLGKDGDSKDFTVASGLLTDVTGTL